MGDNVIPENATTKAFMVNGVLYQTDIDGRLWYWHTPLWQRVRRFFGLSCTSYPRLVGN